MGYSFLDIIGLWWHGLRQTVLYYIPLIKPDRESQVAPTWFVRVFPDWLWSYYLDADRRPTETFLYNYRYASDVLFKSWLDQLKDQAVLLAVDFVRGFTGIPQFGFVTFSDWIVSIRERVGWWVPHWSASLADGLEFLYLKLPSGVRHNLITWSGLFDDLRESIKEWVRGCYDRAISNIGIVWGWVQDTGGVLKAWYDDVGSWVSYVRINFTAAVLGALGVVWGRLVTFDRDALDYYYNLWGIYRQELADFISNPLDYLYDRIESFLVSKW